jgi:DnaJ-domain-containing protein 1
LTERLVRLAQAEWSHLKRRLDGSIEEVLLRHEDVRATATESASRPSAENESLRRAYANLELPYGAPPSEVRTAYRRLMKLYHPDRHADPAKKAAATELVRELRSAYEACLAHASTRP